MELEMRKNKRVVREEDEQQQQQQQQESRRVKKLHNFKGEEEQEEDDGGVPTEEEVEEFFAILRRMKVAVKYFDDKGRGGREWREALETAEVAAVDHAGQEDHDKAKKTAGEEIITEGFDLNAVAPEASESGGV